eukprot:m.515474 g.515474  ORF g.515474 m.515474 type:complete len:193 (-) comp21922_c0_seq18:1946-2524(-)
MADQESSYLPTPKIDHLSAADYDGVYEPAEDTFLLLDALQDDREALLSQRPQICLEIGCGSGVVITFLAQLLQKQGKFLATDVNPRCVAAAIRTAEANDVSIEVVQSDLVTACIGDQAATNVSGAVDVLVFNPPYVVTPSAEVRSCYKQVVLYDQDSSIIQSFILDFAGGSNCSICSLKTIFLAKHPGMIIV